MSLQERITVITCAALVDYAQQREFQSDIVDSFKQQYRTALRPRYHWRKRFAALFRDDTALARFTREKALTDRDRLLTLLLAELSRNYALLLLIAELQGRDDDPRLLVHQACDMLTVLFGDEVEPDEITQHRLVRIGVWQCEGDGPLTLRALNLHVPFWQSLMDAKPRWPGCRPCTNANPTLVSERDRTRVPTLVATLGARKIRGIAVRSAEIESANHLAGLIAAQLGRTALFVSQSEASGALATAAELLGWLAVFTPDLAPSEPWRVPDYDAPFVVLLKADGVITDNHILEVELSLPQLDQREALWRSGLGRSVMVPELAPALLSGPMIETLAQGMRAATPPRRRITADVVRMVRTSIGAERLRLLAQPVHTQEGAFVTPDNLKATFDRIYRRARKRNQHLDNLGASMRDERNLGLRMLFVGESGVGKTLAASEVAIRLHAPLFRANASALLDKFVGESEKHVSALLTDAAAIDAVLLFDEADVLFGRRSQNSERDAGSRFSTNLTNFLLTRIENHPGIVILTANNRNRIDPAFDRRLDFIVEFPQPTASERTTLWREHLGYDGRFVELLGAYCDLAGGNIRNVVLNAASALDHPDETIPLQELVIAIDEEYRKVGRVIPPQIRRIANG